MCEQGKRKEIIDARTSDAIALALRFEAPIFTYKSILDKAGIYLKATPSTKSKEEGEEVLAPDDTPLTSKDNFSNLSIKELNRLLEEARSEERRVGKECRSRRGPYQ